MSNVPVEALEELADEWEDQADNPELADMARHRVWEDAKQLRELIEEHRDE